MVVHSPAESPPCPVSEPRQPVTRRCPPTAAQAAPTSLCRAETHQRRPAAGSHHSTRSSAYGIPPRCRRLDPARAVSCLHGVPSHSHPSGCSKTGGVALAKRQRGSQGPGFLPPPAAAPCAARGCRGRDSSMRDRRIRPGRGQLCPTGGPTKIKSGARSTPRLHRRLRACLIATPSRTLLLRLTSGLWESEGKPEHGRGGHHRLIDVPLARSVKPRRHLVAGMASAEGVGLAQLAARGDATRVQAVLGTRPEQQVSPDGLAAR